ncbi:amino acid permease [Polymorphobacter multimanifer]|uniref:APC family permease n=1 Tax=Polymorphobacter multimanifer TaxID=1070431 RepID=UPI0019CA9558|nr:amino acid permease [Polymorphobacter multimanifer]GGI73302.1 amino acid permease [Polymorphobacter multimanifer]
MPQARLRGRDAVAIAVGIVVGAGIFRTPSLIAGMAASETMMLLAWVAGGVISVVGALCYAELASAYPGAGGDYGFLTRAYGVRTGFLYAWARLSVIQTGSAVLLAYVFGDYASEIYSFGPLSSTIWAAIVIVGLTAINWLGVRAGTRVQLVLTIVEVAAVLMVIAAGLVLAPEPSAEAALPVVATSDFGTIMVLVLLTYGGWNEIVYVTGELPDAPRRIAPLLMLSLGVVTLLYMLANLAYLRGLGLGGMAGTDAVAATLMGRVFGAPGTVMISVAIAVAALTSANATIFTGGRSNWAMGRDTPALRWLGQWDGQRGTPGNALLLQGAVALALTIAGGFARDGFQLAVDYTAPVFWLFFLAVGVALFVLRIREPEVPRPFRVPLYPLLPALFCATNAWLLWSSLQYTTAGALVGVGVLAIGAMLLLFVRPTQLKETVG